jgi:mannose-6-phosphate isomerase-like protein (cupin superfamily)
LNPQSADILPTYLAGLQVESGLCGLNTVSRSWRDIDHVPAYSKFYYILEGEGWLQVGGREFCPRPGQMALMPEGKLQSYG